MDVFCVKCKAKLQLAKKNCTQCGAPFSTMPGYIDLLPSDETYWGEFGRDEMAKLIEKSRTKGYRLACFEYFRNHPRKDLFEYILNQRGRTSFINFIYKKEKSLRCLDLGSGMGAIPEGLSKLFKEVYSIELVRERVEYQVIRKHQDKIDNWTIIKGNVYPLPFPDNHFDFVSANGMLEWAAVANLADAPREAQLKFLKEIKRVLKPDGVAYVGIENRTSISYIRGVLDHSGISYTSLMPRFVANLVCQFKARKNNFYVEQVSKAKGQKYYRTYTYTKWGYKKLLKKVGINDVRIFHTGFTYNLPYAGIDDKAISLIPKSVDVIKAKLTQFKYSTNRFLARAFSVLTPNFLIFFSKGKEEISDFEIYLSEKFGDPGPFYIYRGVSNLIGYSLQTHKFYKAENILLESVNSEDRVRGEIPHELDVVLFKKCLEKLRSEYHKKIKTSPGTLKKLTDRIRQSAKVYGFNAELVENYTDGLLRKYSNANLYSKNHGDLWKGNIFLDGEKISFIDEEKDEYNIVPIELMRFLLATTGYSPNTRSKKHYEKFRREIISIYNDLVDERMLEDFYIASLFYELWRRDLSSDWPRPELFDLHECVTSALGSDTMRQVLKNQN